MNKLRRPVEKFNGLSVGLDLHKRFIQFSVVDPSGGEVEADRIAAAAGPLEALVRRLQGQGQPLRVALEACGCFVWVYDLLKSLLGAAAVQVAAPARVKAIAEAGQKNDASDAWWLAYLVHEQRLPQALVAEGDLRELRSVVDQRSDLMRRLRSHLAQMGLGFAHSAWSSRAGRARIAELVAQVQARHAGPGGGAAVGGASRACTRRWRTGRRRWMPTRPNSRTWRCWTPSYRGWGRCWRWCSGRSWGIRGVTTAPRRTPRPRA